MDPETGPFGNKDPPPVRTPHPSPPPPGWVAEPESSTKDRQTGPGFKENEDSPLSTRLPHAGLRPARRPAASPPAAEAPGPPPSPPPAPWNNQLRTGEVCSAQGEGETHGWGRGWWARLGGNSSWEITQGPRRYPEDRSGDSQPSIPGRGRGCGRDCGRGRRPPQPLGGAQTLHSATRERLSFFNAFNVFQMVRCWMRWSEAVLVAEGTPVPAPISNPFLQETLDRDHAPPPFGCPISSGTVVLSRLVLPPPAPGVSPEPGGPGCLRPLLGTDDVAGPGLVFGARRQVGDDHLHGLQLLVLGRDGAHLIGDLVAFHGDVLPLHAVGRGKTFRADAGRKKPDPGPGAGAAPPLPPGGATGALGRD